MIVPCQLGWISNACPQNLTVVYNRFGKAYFSAIVTL